MHFEKLRIIRSYGAITILQIGSFIITEIRNIMLFYRICNKNGLFLPQIPNWLLDNSNCNFINMKIFKEKYLSKNKNWIDDNLKELFALAQHYGMPTRLLDWTYQFNTALYFGAMDSLEKQKRFFNTGTKCFVTRRL